MEKPSQLRPLPHFDFTFFFLLASLIMAICFLLGGTGCIAWQIIVAIMFIVFSWKNPYGMKFAKANLLITTLVLIFSIMILTGGVALQLGARGGSTNASAGLSWLGCISLIVHIVEIVLLAFLTYKAYKEEPCPWF